MSTLYHYTSLNGIIGILSSSAVWASHVSYLNDDSEFNHALSFAKLVASTIYHEDDYLSAFGWMVRHELEQMEVGELYVASFSEGADILSQWRGYCPEGAGVCLGFDAQALKDFCETKGYTLERCLYGDMEQSDIVKSLVDECLKRFPRPRLNRAAFEGLCAKEKVDALFEYQSYVDRGEGQEQARQAVSWLCSKIVRVAPLFKHRSFNEEAEWRIVARSPMEKIEYRAGLSYMIPYIELALLETGLKAALRQIVIGPNPNQRRCKLSVESFLRTKGLAEVEVTISQTPFNGW